MTILKKFSLLALVGFLLTVGASAETSVEQYLASTDPLLERIVKLNVAFKNELQPLRESKDLVGIAKAVEKYNTNWKGLGEELATVKPPATAKAYHDAVARLVGIQLESNMLLQQTVTKGIQVAKEVQAMKNKGASDEEIKAKVQEFAKGRAPLLQKIGALKLEAESLDGTLKAERAKLDAAK